MSAAFNQKVYDKLSAKDKAEYKSLTAKIAAGKGSHQSNQRINQLINASKSGKPAPDANLPKGPETGHEYPNPGGPPTVTIDKVPNALPTNADTKTTAGIINDQLAANNITSTQNNLLNNTDQNNAFGGRSYTTDPKTGRQVQTDTLSKANQAALDTGQGIYQQGAGAAKGVLSNFNDGVNSDPRKAIQNAIYNNLTQGLETQYGNQKQDLEQQLVNSGNGPGSPAYNRAMSQFENQFQQQRTSAQTQAIQAAGQEMQGEATTAGQLSNMGIGYQNPTYNQFNAYNQTSPDVGGVAYQTGNLANTQQQNANTLQIGQGANAASLLGSQAQMVAAQSGAKLNSAAINALSNIGPAKAAGLGPPNVAYAPNTGTTPGQ